MEFIWEQFIFYTAIALTLFLPGYFFLLALFGKKGSFIDLEKIVLSFGIGLVILDFGMILLSRLGILLTRTSLVVSLLIFIFACFGIFHLRRKKYEVATNSNLIFSRKQAVLIIAILFLTIFFKTTYLQSNILPSATDLGHHIYWSKIISTTGLLPDYAERDIIEVGDQYAIGPSEPISDFIIGEHLVFSAINLVTGIDYLSYFPIILLLLINIISVLAIFILALRMFQDHPQGKTIAILALILIGPLFAISSPQAKYVSGGVIGNIIGNLLLPLVFYFIFRSISEKKPFFLALGIFTALGLFYTHHLTAFIFIFSMIFSLAILLVMFRRSFLNEARKWMTLFLSPPVLVVLTFGILFFFLVAAPDYIRNSAVETVVGSPTRTTKEGLTLVQIQDSVGQGRFALGAFGVLMLLFFSKGNSYQRAVVSGWFLAIFFMTWKPAWLHIDIPSTRIANYLIFPAMLSGAFAWSALSPQNFKSNKSGGSVLPSGFLPSIFLLLFLFVFIVGFYDNAQSLKDASTDIRSIKTFAVAEYLAEKTGPEDVIVKDHNYAAADAWMKVFLMRDYNMPLTRGFFFRYEPPYKRNKCTLWVISDPASADAQKCFRDLGINFIVINPQYDKAQFEKDKQFWPVYSNRELTVYYRHP